MGRKKPRPPQPPPASHGRSCVCRGTGFVAAPDITHENGATYTKVSVRCPGVAAWTPPAPNESAQPKKASGQDAAAGDRTEG